MHTGTLEDLTLPDLFASIGGARWLAGGFHADGLPVEDLLAHVSRRLEELAEIKTLVPSEEAVLAMAPQPPEGAVQINITPGEWRVLVMVDGRRSVREIATASGVDDIAAMKVLYGLATAGLVALTDGRERVSAEEVSDTTDMSDVSVMSDVIADEVVEASEPEPVTVEPEPEPEKDPFLSELEALPATPFPSDFVAPTFEEAAVDRSTAARELAGLFDEPSGFAPPSPALVTAPPAPPRPRRIEDDDQVTRGLISRLIDGVKGL